MYLLGLLGQIPGLRAMQVPTGAGELFAKHCGAVTRLSLSVRLRLG